MRTDNEAFQAEVFRRSAAYKQKQRTRRKQLSAGMLVLICCIGGLGAYRLSRPKYMIDNAVMETQNGTQPAEASIADMEEAEDSQDALGIPNDLDIAPEDNNGADQFGDADAAVAGNDDTRTAGAIDGDALPMLTLKTEFETYAANTAQITLTIQNDGAQSVMLEEMRFSIEFEDADGNGIRCTPAMQNAEDSGSVSAYSVAGQGTAEITLSLEKYGFTSPLPTGTYRIWYDGCEPAEFTVK